VWGKLQQLKEDHLVDLEDAAIIRRDKKGQAARDQPGASHGVLGTLGGMSWGTLIGLLLLFPLFRLPRPES
jgi:uncharacterized membrane protein